jgi:hypothetical protein
MRLDTRASRGSSPKRAAPIACPRPCRLCLDAIASAALSGSCAPSDGRGSARKRANVEGGVHDLVVVQPSAWRSQVGPGNQPCPGGIRDRLLARRRRLDAAKRDEINLLCRDLEQVRRTECAATGWQLNRSMPHPFVIGPLAAGPMAALFALTGWGRDVELGGKGADFFGWYVVFAIGL